MGAPRILQLPQGHSRESGNLGLFGGWGVKETEIPAFAGMTRWVIGMTLREGVNQGTARGTGES